MKRTFELIILTLLSILSTLDATSQIPTLDWVGQIGGVATDIGNAVTYDASGNVYTTGGFLNTVDFDPGTGVANLTSAGNRDIFIQKLDATGNFLWAKQIGGVAKDEGMSISIDSNGDIYILGQFSDTVDFDPSSGQAFGYAHGSFDIFIQKLDANGNFLWVKTFGSTYIDGGESLTVDNDGNVYATGFFRGTVDFDPGVGVVNLDAVDVFGDAFILKLDTDGDYVWVKHIDGNQSEHGHSIALDTFNNIYLTGTFSGTADFDPSTSGVESLTASDFDIFVLKLNALGNYVWVKQMGGTGAEAGASIAVNESGDVYITGEFNSTSIDFNPGTGTSNFYSLGWNDIFVQKLDSNGNYLWAKQMGGVENDRGIALTIDESGDVYITGSFKDSVDFNPNSGSTFLQSSGYEDIFIQKLDADGNFMWANRIGGSSSDEGRAIAVDADKNLYLTGGFMTAADFDSGTGVTSLSSLGSFDAFVLKLSACYPSLITPELATLNDVTGECSATNTFIPTANNDCGIPMTATTTTTFPITTQGTTVVVWEYDDGHGNTLTQNQNFIVNDINDPVPDNGVLTDLFATCVINLTDVDIPTGTDDCLGAITATANVTFPITDPTITEIVWTFEDNNENTYAQTQTITWDTINTEITIIDQTISSANSGGNYQWLDCNNNYQPISGETNATFTALTNGSYALEITKNGCVDTTACTTIANVGVQNYNALNTLVVSPNPTTGIVLLAFDHEIDYAKITLTDMLGRVIYKTQRRQFYSTSIDILGSTGLYVLTISTKNGQKIIEILKD